MKPMLAATVENVNVDVEFPVYASPKLDGIRGVVVNGVLKSRSLKDIPNPYVRCRFSYMHLDGLDGELVLGDPTAKDVYRVTNSACSQHTGSPDIKFYVFDNYGRPGIYKERWIDVLHRFKYKHIIVVENKIINDTTELLAYEQDVLSRGYEGLILRNPYGEYKYGRSTIKEGGMLKLKRFSDGEAEIIEVYEEQKNNNEKVTNELGRGARSSHKENKVGKGRAGGLTVKDIKTGVVFSVGTGLNDIDKEWYWKHRGKAVGKIIKYKYFAVGVKDAPRHPVYLGKRGKWDL